jgi:hypothetical protein
MFCFFSSLELDLQLGLRHPLLEEEDEDDLDPDYEELYDELGRTPPRTRMLQNRKWKDTKKTMNEMEQ